jgi:hypothetical protein
MIAELLIEQGSLKLTMKNYNTLDKLTDEKMNWFLDQIEIREARISKLREILKQI